MRPQSQPSSLSALPWAVKLIARGTMPRTRRARRRAPRSPRSPRTPSPCTCTPAGTAWAPHGERRASRAGGPPARSGPPARLARSLAAARRRPPPSGPRLAPPSPPAGPSRNRNNPQQQHKNDLAVGHTSPAKPSTRHIPVATIPSPWPHSASPRNIAIPRSVSIPASRPRLTMRLDLSGSKKIESLGIFSQNILSGTR